MDLTKPHTAILSTSTGDVLAVLARTTRPLTGREVARLANTSQTTARRSLARLADQGVVTVDEAGSSLLYTLNREHLLAPAILLLTDARAALWERITREIGQWSSAPRHVSVFGSAARGDGGTSSDIDVFIVRPNSVTKDDSQWRAQIESLAADVYRWTGNRAGIAEVSDRELARLRREQPPVAESLRSDAITLVGPPAGELLSRRC